jgi:hypothetical protein
VSTIKENHRFACVGPLLANLAFVIIENVHNARPEWHGSGIYKAPETGTVSRLAAHWTSGVLTQPVIDAFGVEPMETGESRDLYTLSKWVQANRTFFGLVRFCFL